MSAGSAGIADTAALATIYTIPVGVTTDASTFVVFTLADVREKWMERQRDRVATGARYWRRRRMPGWLR
jgi:hypothetical protein